MFYLLMTFCLAGQECQQEVVAQFPQYDVGMHMCRIAKPAMEKAIRAKVSASTRVTFECVDEDQIP